MVVQSAGVIKPTSPKVVADFAARIDEIFSAQWNNRAYVAKTTAGERAAKIKRILDWTLANLDDIRAAGFADYRKPAAEVDLGEVLAVTSEARHSIRHLKKWMKPKRVAPTLAMATTRSWIQYEPVGVVLIIAPWNYPFNLTIGPLISAIAAGNCVCIKPSEMTPNMSALMKRMVSELFPENEVALFEGEVEVSSALLAKPFNHIFFTGSPAIGKVVMKAASAHLAGVTLELGGKSPTIVDETADINDAAGKLLFGKFFNNGQTCIAPDYLLVHDKSYDALIKALKKAIDETYGRDTQARKASDAYTRIVNARHYGRLKNMLETTCEMGAELVHGGGVDDAENFIEPTLLGQVPLDSPAMTGEIFGPILPILRYSDLGEALELINSKEKPLALYIFSHNKTNINRIMAETSAGGTCINEVTLHFSQVNLPFGGVNNSGIGKSHGHFGFLAFSNERAVLKHHKYSPLKMMMPPYGATARKLIEFTTRHL